MPQRYFRRLALLTAMAALFTTGSSAMAQNYRSILTNTERPEAERSLDEARKPDEVMAFYGVKSGDKVADLLASRGYYTVILSELVGPKGLVYAANPAPRPELNERVKKSGLSNVRIVEGPFEKIDLPQDGSLDFVLIHLDYHELAPDVRAAMNRRVFAALKPGGVYGIVDHSAKEGSGDEAAKTLHRIDKLLVIKEAAGAGFRLGTEGEMLRRPDDTRDFSVVKERNKDDRFVLKFEKP